MRRQIATPSLRLETSISRTRASLPTYQKTTMIYISMSAETVEKTTQTEKERKKQNDIFGCGASCLPLARSAIR